MQNRRQVGSTYEKIAEEYLKRSGYRICERNFRCRMGEVDLIALDGNVLVFLEVKYRKNTAYGNPAEAVTPAKRRTICKVASYYRLIKEIPDSQPCRFDVVSILGNRVEVIKHAFEYC